MITLNGYTLDQFQRCKRLYRIGLTHISEKWYPQSLLGACLRHAIFHLSAGKLLEYVSDTAVQFFLSAARNPGLDTPHGIDVYALSMDYTSIIRNVLEHLSRTTLYTLHEIKPKRISDDVYWEFLSRADDMGVLHRWQFVDYIPEDVLPELHSWEVFGDIAAMESPMILHLIAIGRRRKSHQESPWCRIYAHPRIANTFRFNKKSGNALEGDWKPIYFSTSNNNTARTWVNWMERDGAAQPLIKDIHVKEISANDRQRFKMDVLVEAEAMEKVSHHDPKNLPMSRYACDHPYTCPHQYYCYTYGVTLDSVGMYKTRSKKVGGSEVVKV